MRTSLNELKEAEDFLAGNMKPEETVLFRAKLLVNPALRMNTGLQYRLYGLLRQYGRKKLKTEIEQVHNELFQGADHFSFRQKIYHLFSKS